MNYKLGIFSFFILFNIFNSFVYSQSLQSLQIEFERFYKEKNREEIIEGSIYYNAPGSVIAVVEKPINQWIIFGKYGMDIYYPVERKAFRFITQNPVLLPFFQAFLGVVKKDYGLMDIGYTLSYHKKREDTLFTYWAPPKQLSKILGDFTLLYVSNRINYAEFEKPDGTIMSKSFYSNHIHHDTNYFPLEITTIRYIQADSTIEKITYSNPQFNIELSKEVLDFKIPPDVGVEEIEW